MEIEAHRINEIGNRNRFDLNVDVRPKRNMSETPKRPTAKQFSGSNVDNETHAQFP